MKKERIYANALGRLYRYAKTHNLRPAAIRKIVLEQTCYLHQPFVAEQLIEACKQERISTATIYNSLRIFVKAGILRESKRHLGQPVTEYELISDNVKHMQLICKTCGRITDFSDRAIGRLIEERKYQNFNMQHYSLIVYGECKICRSKKIE